MIMDSMLIVMLDDGMDIGSAAEEGMAMAEVAPIAIFIGGDAESMLVIVAYLHRVPRKEEFELKFAE
ncbi:hypothetical protein THARTR1_07969 [Trichoderma harzianum]|uniref:Uncharacterized protein n=1 Tax=Trichoderma harzianum TaxID=5544 RepID=A0A2K0U0W4_TRIHA|nr:hypothetical protein THARTR1_07969 [Trichoderma harzianum]